MSTQVAKTLATIGLLAATPFAAMAADAYKTDQGHTEVHFGWSHFGVSTQTGEFTEVDGTLMLDEDDISKSTLEVTVSAASLATGFGPLDDHLKSADFFEVETYPEITFKSTSVTQTGDKTADVTGDLTMHGVTLPVTLKTTLTFQGEHPVAGFNPAYAGAWVAFEATGVIENHLDFGIGPFPAGPVELTIVTEMQNKDG